MSGARTAVEVVMTSLNWRTRVHRPAESALPEIEIVTAAEIAAETTIAATLSQVEPPGQDGRLVLVLHSGQEADSDQLGRSTPNLVVVAAAQGSVDWPHIDRLGYIGCRQAPF